MHLTSVIALSFAAIAGAVKTHPLGCSDAIKIAAGPFSDKFQSVGSCAQRCDDHAYAYMAIKNGTDCYCVSEKPPVSDHQQRCNMTCPGFPDDKCGGQDAWSVYRVEYTPRPGL